MEPFPEGVEEMKKIHKITSIRFKDVEMILVIDAKSYSFDLAKISSKLKNATPEERSRFEISPSGYGIHWPLLDEDLSIDGLMGVKHVSPQQKAAS
jgi:hypothetical protein